MNQGWQQSSVKQTKVVRKIGGYELLTRLGEGGSGTVFKARQPGLDRFVAIKVLSPQLSKQSEYIQRFRNEARAAGSVNHLNIVQVLDAGFDEKIQVPFIIYEYIDGVTLTKMIEERGPLPEKEALAVVKAMGEALGVLSEKGLIHRDVKPDNILITRNGIPKLTDLGLAKQESDWESITATGIVMGTPDYMAPEQATGQKDLNLATDYYALGLTLYVMLTAQLPYHGETLVEILTQHLQKDCPDPRIISPWVSKEAARLVALMAHRDRNERYGAAAPLIRDITLANSGKTPLGPKVIRPSKRQNKAPQGANAKRRRTSRTHNRGGHAKNSMLSSSELAPHRDPRRRSSHDYSPPEGVSSLEMSGVGNVNRRRGRKQLHIKEYIVAFFIGGLIAVCLIGLPRMMKQSLAPNPDPQSQDPDRPQ